MELNPDKVRRAAILLGIEPTRRGHYPVWLTKAARRAFSKTLGARYNPADVGAVDVNACAAQFTCPTHEGRSGLLDHVGSIEKGRVFVSEPYHVCPECVAAFASALGLRYSIRPDSWHYPGGCFRIRFSPAETKGQ